MICKECENKNIIRGIKHVKCINCGKDTMVNFVYSDICLECSNNLLICQCCGKEIKKDSFYHLSWLEIAVARFKKQNKKVHAINGSMTINEFIKEWMRNELCEDVELD